MPEEYPDFSNLSGADLFHKLAHGSDRERAAAKAEIEHRRFQFESDAQVNMKVFLDRVSKELVAGLKEAANIQTAAAEKISKEQYKTAQSMVTATKWVAGATVALAVLSLIQFLTPLLRG